MSQFFESIKLYKGKFYHLELHSERMNATRKQFFENVKPINLKSILPAASNCPDGLYKFKVIYDKNIVDIEPSPYEIQNQNTVQIIENNEINYQFKSTDRKQIESFKGTEDAIFVKNKLLTDASYSNVILQKNGIWYTPKSCLLEGIKRKVLLKDKKIVEADIKLEEISDFEKIAFVNAMRDFEKVYKFTLVNNILHLTLCS